MSDSPYRTPGETISNEERRRRWKVELEGYMISDWRNWTTEQRQKADERVRELRKLLGLSI